MREKENLTKYFAAHRVMHRPLYQLVAGAVSAVILCGAALGVAAAAGTVVPAATGAQSTPAPAQPAATAETAILNTEVQAVAHQALPEIYAEITVVQQEIGVQLYLLKYPKQPVFDDPADEEQYIAKPSEKQPLTGMPMDITVADEQGEETTYALDTENGTILAEDLTPGDYTVTVPVIEGYTVPAPATVTVKEKVNYTADVQAVKDKIVQASEVVESQEDNGGSGNVVPDEVTDTVPFAESDDSETGEKTVYTAKTSADGFLLMEDGTVAPYRPIYDGEGNLTGAEKAAPFQVASAKMDAEIVFLGNAPAQTMELQLASAGLPAGEQPSAQEAVPFEPENTPTPAESATATPGPTAQTETTPLPEAVPFEPENTPAPTEGPTATPAPTVQAETTPAPEAVPFEPGTTEGQTATQGSAGTDGQANPGTERFDDMPASIPAEELAGYGFAVTSETKAGHEYTGWQTMDGKTYYYDPATHQPVTGMQVIQGNVYTFAADGSLNQTARGIDVSKFQGNIDWNAVAADGITFAIIRCGYRGYGSGALVEDSTFRQNINGAIAAGLRVGVYFYSQAVTEEEAVEEASMVISLCSGYNLPLGVYYDTEKVGGDTGRADGISASQRTACAVAFCQTIQNSGYTAGVYSYASWFYNALNFANVSRYRIWIAQYRDTLDFGYNYNIWQYTGSGTVRGINKPVDMNLG